MALTKEQIEEINRPNANLEKNTTLSSDGKNLLTRIPKEITEKAKLTKGNKIKWVYNPENNTIKLIPIN